MPNEDTENRVILIEMTTRIVSAYVSNNKLEAPELLKLIDQVYSSLLEANGLVPSDQLVPAVPIDQSVTADHIICLEDGKSFKSLKRHLSSQYDMSPEAYRSKWNLPADYPMVAPNYAKARSALAKKAGLGRNIDEEAAAPDDQKSS